MFFILVQYYRLGSLFFNFALFVVGEIGLGSDGELVRVYYFYWFSLVFLGEGSYRLLCFCSF